MNDKTRHTTADRAKRLALPGLCALAVLASALGLGAPPKQTTPERITILTGQGRETYVLTTPDAPRSDASRVNTDRVNKRGWVPRPTPGHIVHARVVVRTDHGATILEQAHLAGIAMRTPPRRIDGTKGFWTVPTETIADADRLARALATAPGIDEAYVDVARPLELRGTLPTDPLFNQQWHLRNTDLGGVDIGVEGAWALGYTGDGITIGITELGFFDHPEFTIDLIASQAGAATFHGTNVAGLAAANRDEMGTVGVAYDARLSRQYIGSAATNASAFGFRNDLNHVKNNSWGPPDDARVRALASVESDALREAAMNGRNGLGTVLVWASGNGGQIGDRADYDPFTSSRYTISVSSVDDFGIASLYTEPGSCNLVCAPSDFDIGDNSDRGIVTTTSNSGHTFIFGGTSASAPQVAGVIALMLEANPALSWRDVQHILVDTAIVNDDEHPLWSPNGAGRPFNDLYGFGLVDAGAAVALAETFSPVDAETTASTGVMTPSLVIPDNGPALELDAMIDSTITCESVEIVLSVTHPDVGDLELTLTSPDGTTSLLSETRNDSTSNLAERVFTTVRHWDEQGQGQWTLSVRDQDLGSIGQVDAWELRINGTAPAACACDWNTDGFLNAQDFFDFVNSFFADNDADFNNDAMTNDADFFDFVNCFMAPPEACND